MIALCASALTLSSALAQMQPLNVPLFTDKFVNSFFDTYDGHTEVTSPTYNGSAKALKIDPGQWTRKWLAAKDDGAPFNATPFDTLCFWVNGGNGGQTPAVTAIYRDLNIGGWQGRKELPAVSIMGFLYDANDVKQTVATLPANTWLKCKVPFSALGITSAYLTRMQGFNMAGSGDASVGLNTNPVYVDEVRLLGPAPAGSVNVSVNAAAPGATIDDRLFGINLSFWAGWTADNNSLVPLEQALTDASLRCFRFGSGTGAEDYDWSEVEHDPWANQPELDDFVHLLTSQNCDGRNAFIIANYGRNSPGMAVAWAAFSNFPDDPSNPKYNTAIGAGPGRDHTNYDQWITNKDWKTYGFWAHLRASAPLAQDDGWNKLRHNHPAPYGFKNWEIGNECYLRISGKPDDRPTDQQFDPMAYALFFRNVAPRLKDVDPNIKCGAVITSGAGYDGTTKRTVTLPGGGTSTGNWDDVVYYYLSGRDGGAQVIPDFVIDHSYRGMDRNQSDIFTLIEPTSQAGVNWAVRAQGNRSRLNSFFGAAASNIEITITETNTANTALDKTSTSLVNGLFLADTVGQLSQTEYRSMVWWETREGGNLAQTDSFLYGWRLRGNYGILSGDNDSTNGVLMGDKFPTYYAYKLLSKWARQGDRAVALTGTGDANTPWLSAYAVKKANGDLSLLVINKAPPTFQSDSTGASSSSVNQITANFSLGGFTPAGTGTAYRFGVNEDNAAKASGTHATDLAQSSISSVGSSFSYSFPAYSMTVITLPAGAASTLRDPENPANTVNGVDRKYYRGTWSALPGFDSLTPASTSTSANFAITPNDGDNFGYVFTGYVDAPTDGTYTFYTSSDDGSKLYIGSTQVVDNDGLHGTQERSGTIGLKAGKHAVKVTFFENSGGEALSVSWSGPNVTKQTIPDSRLYRVNTASGASATFISADTTTQGNWKGAYGSDGYNVIGDASSYPAYAAVTAAGKGDYTWDGAPTDARALQRAASGRIASSWYSTGTSFDVTVNVSGGTAKRVAFYCLDWDGSNGRTETVQPFDASTGGSLGAAQTVSSFSGGKYLVYDVNGNVKFTFTKTAGANAVISGVFFSPGGAALFSSGLETADIQPTWLDSPDTAYNNSPVNVLGYLSTVGPECSPRTLPEAFNINAHGGSKALMYSGTANGGAQTFCYNRVFSVNIPISSATKLGYWICPQQDNGRYMAVDFVCTDGSVLRDSGATDQNGASVHPNAGHGGAIALNGWTQIRSNIGQWLAGKTISKIFVAYDHPGSAGQFRGYIDDLVITNGSLP